MTDFPGNLSPFRAGFLKVALFIGGAWVEIPTTELEGGGVSIARPEGQPGSASFTVRDPTGKWSPRHPSSPYYGLIGRGTPVRVQVEMTAGVVSTRFYGEVVTWQPRWGTDGARKAVVDVECAGALRRLAQGAAPLRSPLYRAIKATSTADLVAYWPMEDGRDAKSFSADVGGRRMTVSSGGCTPAGYDLLASSEPIPTIGGAALTANPPSYLSSTQAQVRWVGTIPAGTPVGAVLVRVRANGTLGWVDVRHGGGTSLQIEGYNDAGASVGAATWGYGTVEDKQFRFSLALSQSGADISVTLGIYEPNASVGLFNAGTFFGVTLGSISQIVINPNRSALGDVAIGHLSLERVLTDLFTVSVGALAGYAGEAADVRFNRLCAENGVTSTSSGGTSSRLMGVQGLDDLMTLLRECEATDRGQLYEPRSATDLGLLTGESFYSQTPVTIPYVDNLLLPFEPVEDDRNTRNVVTVSRAGGATATAQASTGPLGTSAVGIYDESSALSLFRDEDAEYQAAWSVHVGTFDEARWPVIGFDLADPRIGTGLRDSLLLSVGLGGRVDVTGVPPWLPPFTVSQIVRGYTERITPHSYRIELACEPARPYRVPSYGDTADRWSGAGTVTAGALTATQTTFTIVPAGGVGWTSVDGPYEIVIGGEIMRVTSVTGGTSFTVVRSVNGVRKAHLTGAAVALADPVYYGL